MALTKYKLGDLIEQTYRQNTEKRYGKDSVCGMTITKEIIPTKADVSDSDLSKYLIVYPKEFIYNPRTHGKKIGLGFNDTDKNFIISWNNIAFRIKDLQRNKVLPEYLYLHFNRTEWDRWACFSSWGSSTEVFAWEALCDMNILLPSIEVQQKYVDIYNAMVANQKAYEKGLDDLKLVCDGFIDKIKHDAPYINVGQLVQEIDVRNKEGYITQIQGINITKDFMPSNADVQDESIRNYKIVKNGQFAFSGMQTGRDKCIRIALYKDDTPTIISPAYTVLEVNVDKVLPEYFMLWFLRSEIDRYGWFVSDGSIRANLDMDRFYEIEIPIPDTSIQQSIVNIYNQYITRKEINEKLKSQIKDLCPILIKGSLEDGGCT